MGNLNYRTSTTQKVTDPAERQRMHAAACTVSPEPDQLDTALKQDGALLSSFSNLASVLPSSITHVILAPFWKRLNPILFMRIPVIIQLTNFARCSHIMYALSCVQMLSSTFVYINEWNSKV
jgi:hypothetical protein